MSDVVDILNGLIKVCKNGEDGYRLAAERAKDEKLRALFRRHSEERAAFASELQQEVRRFGGEPEHTKTLAGTLLTDWMAFADLLDGAKPLALVEEIRRSERNTMSHYESALKADLPVDVRSVVMRQYEQIVVARDQIQHAFS